MSVLPQELLRKISADSHKLSEQSRKKDIPKDSFKELLQVLPTSERPSEKDFFALITEDEDPKEDPDQAVAVPCAAPLAFIHARAESIDSTPKLGALTPAMEAAFEKMASCMIVMSSSNDVETTLFLDNPHFAASSLFGTKITIREFSTAPKAFNIEIVSNPSAIATMEAGKSGLLSAFRDGNFNFTVHRFETHIEQSVDRPVLHRKDNDDREQKDQRGGHGQ